MWSGPKSRYYSSVHVEGLKKFTKTLPRPSFQPKLKAPTRQKSAVLFLGPVYLMPSLKLHKKK
jgi:hypothetical protein